MGSLVIQLFGRKYLIKLLSVLGLLTVINKYLLSIIKINIYKYVLFSWNQNLKFTWLIHGRFHPENAEESALVRDRDRFGLNVEAATSSPPRKVEVIEAMVPIVPEILREIKSL